MLLFNVLGKLIIAGFVVSRLYLMFDVYSTKLITSNFQNKLCNIYLVFDLFNAPKCFEDKNSLEW